MDLLSVVAFACALSLDGFGVGVAYGMRKIRVPVGPLLLISLTSSAVICVTMLFGWLITDYISTGVAQAVGAVILILVGLWIVLQTFFKKADNAPLSRLLIKFRIRGLGLVVQILHEPAIADVDQSGTISVQESFALGLALALDALGAGFGAAMTGFTPIVTPLIVGVVKFLMVSLGVYIGTSSVCGWLSDKASVLSGWVLIFLGLARIIRII